MNGTGCNPSVRHPLEELPAGDLSAGHDHPKHARADVMLECSRTDKERAQVCDTMWGPSEFYVLGSLRHWDIVDRLGEIHVPTLVTSGRYDEATPAIAQTVQHGIAGSQWTIFEDSAHCAHAEEPQRYCQVLEEFLSRVEQAT